MKNILLELRYWASQVVLVVKNPPANAGDIRDGGGHGNALQYSCLENPMDRGAWSLRPYDRKELDMTETT